MTYDDGLVTAVAKAMQSSKAWPVVFQADAAAELSRAAIAAVLEWQGNQDKLSLENGLWSNVDEMAEGSTVKVMRKNLDAARKEIEEERQRQMERLWRRRL
jgi:predicted DNA-binding ribbon-helix-helix protein